MHFQIGDGAAKLVRCGRGAIYDVVVDLRTRLADLRPVGGLRADRGQHAHRLLPDRLRPRLLRRCSDVADVIYKQSNYYADATERGIAYNDPDVAIEWPLPVEELIPSQRDATAPLLRDIEGELPFIYRRASSDPLLSSA